MKILNKIKDFLKNNIFFIIGLIIGILIFTVKFPYYVLAPGGTIDISDRVKLENKKEINGSLNMLYATEFEATLPTLLFGKVLKNWDIEPMEDNQLSNETMEEINNRGILMLKNSIQNAIYVAYNTSGKEFIIKENSHYIIGTSENITCDLKIGDKVIKVDNKNINDVDIVKVGDNRKIGDNISIVIERNNEEKKITCPLISINNEPKIGIYMINNMIYETNPEIKLEFNSRESGSSGGLMMALSIYTSLIDEDIIKGRKIAGTGTIDINGNVGEIGGVKYKLIGAHNEGVSVVFVPYENYEEAKKIKEEYNYNMDIVSVSTFNDAINYLKLDK